MKEGSFSAKIGSFISFFVAEGCSMVLRGSKSARKCATSKLFLSDVIERRKSV